ncbi:putative late blight resistance protein homolog R1B-16 [Sesamum indicum]|uniref:Late blight resistance protein homolog R1B-16 n=1 Tax=Sesamum indicum TaxID=4182 RepID=A0A6I9SPN4_SESIN|nr:putative late blight resistance protein homolog R1B-16 [Sesamum indicum]
MWRGPVVYRPRPGCGMHRRHHHHQGRYFPDPEVLHQPPQCKYLSRQQSHIQMAVAAYASLVSLTDVLDNVQHPSRRHRLHLDKEQIQSLHQKVLFLQHFLELHSQRISPELEDLARQLAVVADEADDVIDFHVVNQLLQRSQDKTHHVAALSSFRQDIDKIIKKIDSITEKLVMVKEEGVDIQEQPPIVSASMGSTAPSSSDKNTMVGFDERLLQVVDELTRDESDLRILPIVGMGGIGKTTLAQNVFDHPYIINRFDIRIWFTISQQYSVRDVLLKYLINAKKLKASAADELDLAKLGESFHKLLFGERYLIVLDDLWSIKAWEDFKMSFPDNTNGSRILVTTRLLDVARPLGFDNHYFTVNFLDNDKSWDLLCEKAFARKSCPYPELEEIGRNIARCCRGLPLAIVVIGGLLAKSNNTREYWKFVAKNVTSFVNSGDDDYCLKILSLSYNSLPMYLKPCFLYMRVFPEDERIEASNLIKSWIGEGFLKPVGGKSVKEAAKEYLKDLADRNLILIRKWTDTGKIKRCSVHDILRELCFRESERERFICIPRAQKIPFSVSNDGDVCFLCSHKQYRQNKIHLQEVLIGLQSTKVASPSVCEACNNMYQNLNKFRWVKVFESVHDESDVTFPLHTKLRYLKVEGYDRSEKNQKRILPGTISLLWNLQILDLGYSKALWLSEVWEMPKLRRLSINSSLPDVLEGQDSTILENLSTLRSSRCFRCSEEVVKRIPNLKKLHVIWPLSLDKLALFNKLESFSLRYNYCRLEDIGFPTSLKKLSLSRCIFPWEKMTIIGSSLPNLEVLKLDDAFKGPEWSPIEGGFLGLKVLSITNHNLEQWGAEDIHFPNLHGLYLEEMYELKEIPLSIGDIYTLQSIHLDRCSEFAKNSAVEIVKDQKEKGNESLKVYVDGKQVGEEQVFSDSDLSLLDSDEEQMLKFPYSH